MPRTMAPLIEPGIAQHRVGIEKWRGAQEPGRALELVETARQSVMAAPRPR